MKAAGLYPGAADLILLWNDGEEMQVRFVETKDKSSQSKNQKDFQKRLEDIGGIYNIWRSLTELYELTISWGLKPIVAPPSITPHSKKALMYNMYHQFMLDSVE